MSGPRWFASPLAGTAGVLAGLGLLAIPLWNLTSVEKAPAARAAPASAAAAGIPAVLRVRLLAPAARLTVTTAAGKVLLDLQAPAAGESEHDAVIPFEGDGTELTVRAELGTTETAVFLTVMPDGHEDQTHYLIGSGAVEESLRYEWHAH